MNCSDARRQIDELVDGRLAPSAEAALRDHCAACPDCAASLGAADAFAAEVASSFRSVGASAPSDLPKRIMRAVSADPDVARAPRIPGIPGIAWIGAAAAAVAAGVVIAFSLAGDEAPAARDSVAERRREAPAPPSSRERPAVATLVSGEMERTRPDAPAADEIARPEPGVQFLAGDVIRASGDEPSEVALPDGTRLFLDVGSEAIIAPSDPGAGVSARTIRLLSGRIFAEVEKDSEPFIVTTAFGDVTTLGTKFGVAIEQGEGGEAELAVSVEEGAVRVESQSEREIVRAGNGCVFRRGRCARRQSGDQCCKQLGWMKQHRERCRSGCSANAGGNMRHGDGGQRASSRAGGQGPAGKSSHASQEHGGQGARHGDGGNGDGAGRGNGSGAGEARREEERRRAEEQKRAAQQEQAQARRRAEEKRRAEERRRAEEKQRAEEQKRAEERKRAEEQKRAEEKRAEEERSRGSGNRGGGGGGRGGSGGDRSGGGGRRGR